MKAHILDISKTEHGFQNTVCRFVHIFQYLVPLNNYPVWYS
jgi:hypothetical protein